MRTWAYYCGLGWLIACSTEPHGTPVALSFGDVDLVAAGAPGQDATGGSGSSITSTSSGMTSTATTGVGGFAGSDSPVNHGPPVVEGFTPASGPWGIRISISGTELGSASRNASLTVGSDLTLAPGDVGIESWTESKIVLRVPFPHEGDVSIETPEGSTLAGRFTPSYEVVAEYPISNNVEVLASVSLEAGGIALALSTNPPSIVSYAGDSWQVEELAEAMLRPETLKLYGAEGGALAAVALSTQSPPELIAFSRESAGFVAQSTGVVATEQAWLAGGPDGAAVWYLASDGFYRARPVSGTWQVDNGPVANVAASEKLTTAAATSDGALWLAWARETGTLLNDKGAPFARRYDGSNLGKEFQCGDDLDDTIVMLDLRAHGRGLLVDYCGADANAVGVGPDQVECRTGVLLSTGSQTRSTTPESDTTKHAMDLTTRITASCDSSQGTLLNAGIWAWPCQNIAALEMDPEGAGVLVLRHDGMLKTLRPR